MIFIGDIAIPHNFEIEKLTMPKMFNSKFLIANFEGALTTGTEQSEKYIQSKKLFNDPQVIDYLKKLNVKLVTLANNHTFDISENINYTINELEKNHILTVGAGINKYEAMKPVNLKIHNEEFLFFSFGWEVIGCKKATVSSCGTNSFEAYSIIEQIRNSKKKNPKKHIIVMFHWNYELELYPQPMFRQLSFDLIDEGVELIIGHHSHCVEGVEFYKDIPIVYSLGNWILPGGFYWNKKLKFPEITKKEMAFEWDYENRKFYCHWFNYDNETQKLNYLTSENPLTSKTITELTPFVNLNNKSYTKWFSEHRRKKKFLPVYKNHKHKLSNKLKDFLVALRGRLIDFLMVINLKSHPN